MRGHEVMKLSAEDSSSAKAKLGSSSETEAKLIHDSGRSCQASLAACSVGLAIPLPLTRLPCTDSYRSRDSCLPSKRAAFLMEHEQNNPVQPHGRGQDLFQANPTHPTFTRYHARAIQHDARTT